MNIQNLLNNYKDFKLIYNEALDLNFNQVFHINNLNQLDSLFNPENILIIINQDVLDEILKNRIIELVKSKNSIVIAIIQSNDIPTIKPSEFKNLIIIPNSYNPKDLVLDILNLISYHQDLLIKENDMINREFMKMNINQSSIEEYINFLSQVIRRDIIYYGKLDHLSHNTGEEFLLLNSLDKIEEADLISYYFIKIKQYSQLYGYIIIKDSPNNIDEKERLLVDYTGNMILIKIQNQIAIENSKEIIRSDLIADLCMDNVKTEEEVSFRASLQGWTIDSGLLAIIFDIDEYKHTMLHSDKDVQELEEEKEAIFNLIINEMKKVQYKSYYYKKSDSIIFLVNVDLENNFSHLDDFVKNSIEPIHNKINNKEFNFTLTVGVGTYYRDVMNTYKSYNEAIEAINISRIFKEIDDISCYKNVVIFKDLMEIMTRRDHNSIYTSLVKNLILLDEKNNTEYFNTLKAIIKNDWNLKSSSKELFIHYNTIIYRYERIKELLGIDLSDFYEKLIITLTVMILEVERHIDFNKGMFKKQLKI